MENAKSNIFSFGWHFFCTKIRFSLFSFVYFVLWMLYSSHQNEEREWCKREYVTSMVHSSIPHECQRVVQRFNNNLWEEFQRMGNNQLNKTKLIVFLEDEMIIDCIIGSFENILWWLCALSLIFTLEIVELFIKCITRWSLSLIIRTKWRR